VVGVGGFAGEQREREQHAEADRRGASSLAMRSGRGHRRGERRHVLPVVHRILGKLARVTFEVWISTAIDSET